MLEHFVIEIDRVFTAVPWHRVRRPLQADNGSAERSIWMRNTGFVRYKVTHLANLYCFSNQTMVTVKVHTIIFFFRVTIHDEASRDVSSDLIALRGVERKRNGSWLLVWWICPMVKRPLRNLVAVDFDCAT